MNETEHGCLETALSNFPARIGRGMRDAFDHEDMLADDEQLTPMGRAWVQGYAAAQLSVIRGTTTGKPNLALEDVEAIEDLVLQHEDEIVAQLYA
ncbi:MAG: hypothetical protein ABEJ31_09125 [Haloarculaceae archaeon]